MKFLWVEILIEMLTNSIIDASNDALNGGQCGGGAQLCGIGHGRRGHQRRGHRLHRLEDEAHARLINVRIT